MKKSFNPENDPTIFEQPEPPVMMARNHATVFKFNYSGT
jgi:hypothetical protein